jgi:preprotein translocase subunit SecD
MMQLPRWRVIVVLAALLLAIVFSVPNIVPASTLKSVPSWVPAKVLNLGLDLQGGSSLLLEVDLAALNREKMNDLMEDVRSTLRAKQIDFAELAQVNGAINVRIVNPAQYDDAYRALAALARPLQMGSGSDVTVTRTPEQHISLTRSADAQRAEAVKAVQQSIEIVRRRVDALGTREPTILQQGANRILVQAPGESDPERLRAVIGKTAKLTFQLVDLSVPLQEAIQAGRVPPGSEVLPSDDGYSPAYLVKKKALVTGEMLTTAQQEFDQNGAPAVGFRFNGIGGKRFGDATSQNVGKPFAIILDGRIISAPNINGPITGGSGIITGNFTPQSANDLALLLRAGALPAPLTVESQSTVGAELGADAVRAGQISTLVGFAAIVVFIVLFYGIVFGGIAVVGLVLNLLMIVAAMSLTQATLTLPGIAGLILTLAVAVDANVLIYERIRDEERGGASPIAAIETGFQRASVSIYDANITTLIAAAIMFFLGSGPVKGFAWTLGVGVMTSVFTAMFVGKVLVAAWFRAAKPKQLPI